MQISIEEASKLQFCISQDNALTPSHQSIPNMQSWEMLESPLQQNNYCFQPLPENITNNCFKSDPGAISSSAIQIGILDKSSNQWIGKILVTPAEGSKHFSHLDLPKAMLPGAVILSDIVLMQECAEVVTPVLLYFALRRARIWQRSTVVTYISEHSELAQKLDLEPLPNFPNLERDNFSLFGQRLDLVIHRVNQMIQPELKPFIHRYFVAELIETLRAWLDRFPQNPWWQAVYQGNLTKQQYIYTLSNLHHFTRRTTRLIARAIAFSEDLQLRNHWLRNIQGEVNHELLIEEDLVNLGADVNYVTQFMVPNIALQQLLVVEESVIGFHQDPILLFAVPYVAEGFTAHLGPSFIEALEKNIESWGISDPKTVTHLMASHIELDGEENGHWSTTNTILSCFLTDDTHLQQFLNVMRLCMQAFDRSFTSFTEDLAIFDKLD